MRIINDNYFTYRQTPVDYDGIAKIDSIKGNSIAWNQLVQNGNFADGTTNWTSSNSTISASSGVLTETATSTEHSIRQSSLSIPSGHKIYFKFNVSATSGNVSNCTVLFQGTGWVEAGRVSIQRSGNKCSTVISLTNNCTTFAIWNDVRTASDVLKYSNIMLIDLTQLGLDSLTASQFESLYPLPYYSYTLGTLVSFNGTGMKTTGKNLLDVKAVDRSEYSVSFKVNDDKSVYIKGTATGGSPYIVLDNATNSLASGSPTLIKKGTSIKLYNSGLRMSFRYANGDYVNKASGETFTAEDDIIHFYIQVSSGVTIDKTVYPMAVFSDVTDDTYEPYFEKTASLPISSYFPTGMKSANTVYDEISNGKAITRVGEVDASSNWSYYAGPSGGGLAYAELNDSTIKIDGEGLCNLLGFDNSTAWASTVPVVQISTGANRIRVYGNFSSLADFQSQYANIKIFYELATPTEADFKEDIYYYFFDKGTEEIYPNALYNGVVDLGSLTWTEYTTNTANVYRMGSTDLQGIVKNASSNTSVANIICAKFVSESASNTYVPKQGICIDTVGRILIYDPNYNTSSSGSAFKNSMSGVLLYYEAIASTPYTTPLLADIIYYTRMDSAIPYRKFWMVNANGERWNLTEREVKSFLSNPQGMGFSKNITVNRYGNVQTLTDITDSFPQPNGDVIFYDTMNSTRYEKYNEFVKFLSYDPITLYYQIPVSFYSQIPNTYTLDCVVGTLTKTESKTDHLMTCSVTYNALSFYKGEMVEISGTGNSYTISNDSDFPIGFEIEIQGSLKNPYIQLAQDSTMYGEAKFRDTTAFGKVYVDSNDGEQNVILEQGGSVLPNPLSYQDLSISNGSIYVTFAKFARGETTLSIGMDSGSITSVKIRYTPLYRSV